MLKRVQHDKLNLLQLLNMYNFEKKIRKQSTCDVETSST